MKNQNTARSVSKLWLTIFVTLLLTGMSTGLYAAVITQPGILISTNPASFSIDAANLLANPNNNPVQFLSGTQATFGSFQSIVTYDSNDLALLLGVSLATLVNTDFIAFDSNGINSGGGGFEDSVWSFTDGLNTLNHNHDFLDGQNGPVLANNEQLNIGVQYNSLFGTSFAGGLDFGVILFDLSSFGIDVTSPDFQVTLQGGGLSCGNECPDVTFMGTASTVPIASAALLLFTGLLGFVMLPGSDLTLCLCTFAPLYLALTPLPLALGLTILT